MASQGYQTGGHQNTSIAYALLNSDLWPAANHSVMGHPVTPNDGPFADIDPVSVLGQQSALTVSPFHPCPNSLPELESLVGTNVYDIPFPDLQVPVHGTSAPELWDPLLSPTLEAILSSPATAPSSPDSVITALEPPTTPPFAPRPQPSARKVSSAVLPDVTLLESIAQVLVMRPQFAHILASCKPRGPHSVALPATQLHSLLVHLAQGVQDLARDDPDTCIQVQLPRVSPQILPATTTTAGASAPEVAIDTGEATPHPSDTAPCVVQLASATMVDDVKVLAAANQRVLDSEFAYPATFFEDGKNRVSSTSRMPIGIKLFTYDTEDDGSRNVSNGPLAVGMARVITQPTAGVKQKVPHPVVLRLPVQAQIPPGQVLAGGEFIIEYEAYLFPLKLLDNLVFQNDMDEFDAIAAYWQTHGADIPGAIYKSAGTVTTRDALFNLPWLKFTATNGRRYRLVVKVDRLLVQHLPASVHVYSSRTWRRENGDNDTVAMPSDGNIPAASVKSSKRKRIVGEILSSDPRTTKVARTQ